MEAQRRLRGTTSVVAAVVLLLGAAACGDDDDEDAAPPTTEPAPPAGFDDVGRDVYYTAAVDWARHTGITTGVGGENVFEPQRPLTRAEAVALVWRAEGTPNVDTPHGFGDVDTDAYYEPAVRWANAAGVTTGVGGGEMFAPDEVVGRAQMITFIWRAVGPPDVAAPHGFVDVPQGSYYEAAVRWASETGVTTGIGDTDRFGPDDDVNRAQAITFLYRHYG